MAEIEATEKIEFQAVVYVDIRDGGRVAGIGTIFIFLSSGRKT